MSVCSAADIQRIRKADLSRFTFDRIAGLALWLGRAGEMRVQPVRSEVAA